jgi:hypothetical protein
MINLVRSHWDNGVCQADACTRSSSMRWPQVALTDRGARTRRCPGCFWRCRLRRRQKCCLESAAGALGALGHAWTVGGGPAFCVLASLLARFRACGALSRSTSMGLGYSHSGPHEQRGSSERCTKSIVMYRKISDMHAKRLLIPNRATLTTTL